MEIFDGRIIATIFFSFALILFIARFALKSFLMTYPDIVMDGLTIGRIITNLFKKDLVDSHFYKVEEVYDILEVKIDTFFQTNISKVMLVFFIAGIISTLFSFVTYSVWLDLLSLFMAIIIPKKK